ncbi:MAG TPA: hypothetical protein VL307_11730 [Chitinophagaceae bacterium]|nr:hypothetical protein [Chitinophagaceae bacterium]
MINSADLHIEEEVLPLFDATFNYHSGQAVRTMLSVTLPSVAAITERQNILKGFIAHRALLKDYSFSRFNLAEIYDFLEGFAAGTPTAKNLRWKLTFSEKERQQKRGRLILLVRLFYKIHTSYTAQLDKSLFPAAYAADIAALNDFFADFNLERYETAFKKNKFRITHIIELLDIIAKKVTNGQLAAFWNRWFLFEAYLSVSNAIIKNNFVFPVFDEDSFALEGIYHPFLKNPVRNDLKASNNVILLTGPNMSGKSTLLKAVSLCVYLGHAGIGVPAAKATMPFFQSISVAINLTDSIVSGYSHFMSEVVTLKNVLLSANRQERCFAVFDELFRGTNIEDALEISTSTIQGLARFPRSLFFISTHLQQLRELPVVQSNKVTTLYIDCMLKDDLPVFTYQLKEGWSNMKVGRILFEKEGLNQLLLPAAK